VVVDEEMSGRVLCGRLEFLVDDVVVVVVVG
jgi:hypothetical protein